LCAQDIPEDFAIGGAKVSNEMATVQLVKEWNTGTLFQSTHTATVQLQLIDGRWLISDILCDSDVAPPASGSLAPASESMQAWQIFVDDVYGFQIRYPEHWLFEEGELLPPEETPEGQKALKRSLFFQPQGWDGVAAPLHIQTTYGTQEEFERLYVPATATESLTINGYEVVKVIEDIGGVQVIRYIFQSPSDENLRVVALDYISGFPERAQGQDDVIDALQQVLSAFQFTR
jgi:hypothetical protein